MRTVFRTYAAGFLLLTGLAAAGAEFTHTVDWQGWPLINRNGAPIVQTKTVFWAANWKWAGVDMKAGAGGDANRGAIGDLGIEFRARLLDPRQLPVRYELRFDVAADIQNAIGGGFEFDLDLRPSVHGGKTAAPELLPDNRGWEWRLGPGETLRCTFEPALASLYFERGQKNRVRCLFYSGAYPAGARTYTMCIELPEGSQRVPSLAERYGPDDQSRWFKQALDPHQPFVDLSFLNDKPAGTHGPVRVQGDALVFQDGTPARFWGCNVQAYTLFMSDRKLVEQHARRIAALGFNLVRLHHHDSQTWVRKCLLKQTATSQELDPEALDSYFYWVKCLRDQGIYLWIDLHVGRTFRQGDGIPGFDELLAKSPHKEIGAEAKGYVYVNSRLRELMQQFNEKLLATENPHTGVALKNDPAVMGVLITNEDDLTQHFGNALLADKGVPYHHAIFTQLCADFAAKTGLPPAQVLKTWEPGASKFLLNDLEYRWNRDMIAHLRGLGLQAPIATCQQWGDNPMFSLPALTAGDVIDTHSYEDGEFVDRDPRSQGNFADYIARAQIAGLPLMTTEYNASDNHLMRDAFTVPLFMAATAAFQGWDAPMLYGYSQDALANRGLTPWSSYNFVSIMGLMPAAAIMYRQGHVRPAERTYVVQLTRDTCYMQRTGTELSCRTLAPQHRLLIALPEAPELEWDRATAIPDGATVITDLNKDFVPAGQSFVESDTRELRRDWEQGVFSVNTPKTQAVVGWLHGRRLELTDVTFAIDTPKAAVAVTSLDGRPIAESATVLVSAVARCSRGKEFLSEPVAGSLTLRHTAEALTLIPLNGAGAPQDAVPLTKDQGVFLAVLPTDRNTHWFLIRPPGPAATGDPR